MMDIDSIIASCSYSAFWELYSYDFIAARAPRASASSLRAILVLLAHQSRTDTIMPSWHGTPDVDSLAYYSAFFSLFLITSKEAGACWLVPPWCWWLVARTLNWSCGGAPGACVATSTDSDVYKG